MKKVLTILFAIIISQVIMIGFFAILMQKNQAKLIESQNKSFNSHLLVETFHLKIEQLSDYCKEYMITNNTEWKEKYTNTYYSIEGKLISKNGNSFNIKDSIKNLGLNQIEKEILDSAIIISLILKERESRFFEIQDSIYNASQKTHPTLIKSIANPAIYDIFEGEYPKIKEDFNILSNALEKLLSKRTIEEELKYRSKGEFYLNFVIGSLLIALFTTLISYIIFRKRISNTEKISKALSASEDRFRTIFEQSPLPIIQLNKDGVITNSNIAFTKFTGFSKTETSIMHYGELVHQDEKEDGVRKLNKIIEGCINTYNIERKYQHKNGNTIWGNLFITKLSNLKDSKDEVLAMIEDISEQKAAINELKSSELKFKLLFENSGSHNSFFDLHGNLLAINSLSARTLGGVPEDFTGKTLFDIFPQKQAETIIERMEEVSMSNSIKSHETEFILNGQRYIFITTYIPVRSHKNQIIGMHMISRDITEQKIAEDELEFVKYNLAQAQNIASIGSFDFNIKTNKLFWSDEMYNIFEVNREETPSLELVESIIHESDKGVFLNSMKNFLHDSLPKTIEYKINPSSGQIKHLQSSVRKILDNDGFTEKLVGAVQDITDKKRTEESLNRLNIAVEQSANQIIITNIAGKILYVNKKFTETTGFTKEEVLGKNPRILKSDYHTNEFYQNLWTTILAGKVWKGEMKNLKKSKEMYWESCTIAPVYNDESSIINFIAIKEDITKLKESEQRILKAVVATEEKNRQKFSEDLHDDLGPYLSGIKLYLENLEEKELTHEKKLHFLNILNEMIDESVNKIREISNMLMPSTLQNLGLVKSIKSFAERLNRSEKIKIEVIIVDEPPFLEKIDEISIYRIINELVNNTIKHANASAIKVIIKADNNNLSIEYIDDGDGFNFTAQLEESKGNGLRNIKNRFESLGAEYRILNMDNKGFAISFSISIKIN